MSYEPWAIKESFIEPFVLWAAGDGTAGAQMILRVIMAYWRSAEYQYAILICNM
jgi:hypothetical protein